MAARASEAEHRQANWDPVYDGIATLFVDDPFPFLNLGYVDPARPHAYNAAADPQIWERLSEQLYSCTLTGVSVADRAVLEVGSGRGGGSAYVAQSRGPVEMVGLDRSRKLIEWCSAHHRLPNLRFHHGDAMRLPFADDRFDVVVNVESSHCYPSRLGFFREVERVLRPGGIFALADVFLHEGETKRKRLEGELREAGLRIVDTADITRGVIEARDQVSRSTAFNERLRRVIPSSTAEAEFRQLACFEGTKRYRALTEGDGAYWRWVAMAK